MSDEIRHECAVAMVVLRRPPSATDDFGGTKLSLLLEKQHNRGQDGAGAAILRHNPEFGAPPYQVFKSASSTPLADVLGAIAKRARGKADAVSDAAHVCHGGFGRNAERVFLGHLRYATYGRNDVAFCHPFVHGSSALAHTFMLAGNFNLTNTAELFERYRGSGAFPTSRADGYLITELVAHGLETGKNLADAISSALSSADGAWTLVGATGAGEAFAVRDPHGIRPCYFLVNDDVAVVASERPAIQAAFDVSPESVKELPPGKALVISPDGGISWHTLADSCGETSVGSEKRSCSFERIYFSRANDADIHRERRALGAALAPQILEAADSPMEDIFFSYIPNSARIAFHGLLEELFGMALVRHSVPRFGEIAVKDAKFRTFIADAAARREFYRHVYDVTYGLVRPGADTLVVLDDSIVRGNTMKNAILPMLDRLGPKRIVIASSAPPIRYPDCYGIDMSTLGELVAFRALVNLLGKDAERKLRAALMGDARNPLEALYARFSEKEHSSEIARLLTPPGMKAEIAVVFQTVPALRRCLQGADSGDRPPDGWQPVGQRLDDGERRIGDWYFTGDYPTPGGYCVLRKALLNYLERNTARSY